MTSGRHRLIAWRREYAKDRRSPPPGRSRTVSFVRQGPAPTPPGFRTRSWENWWNRSRARPCPVDRQARDRAQPGRVPGLLSRIVRSCQGNACARPPAPRRTDRDRRKRTRHHRGRGYGPKRRPPHKPRESPQSVLQATPATPDCPFCAQPSP